MSLPAKFDPIHLASWTAEYGPIPDSYVALDVESTGVDVTRDVPVQLGWCVVKDRRAVLETAVMLDWSRVMTAAEAAELETRMRVTRTKMLEQGKAYPWTPDLLKAKGLPPAQALGRLASALAATGDDPAVAAHYGWLFDYPVLGRVCARVGLEFAPSVDRMLDTGLMIKACLVGVSPSQFEPMPAYVRRLQPVRCPVKHNLEACVEMFDLRRSAGVQTSSQHTAAYDSWIVHNLVERLRDVLHVGPATPRRD